MKRIFLLVLILGFGTPDALAANTYERVAEVIQLSVEFGSLRGNPDGTMSENTYRVGSKLLRDAYQKASSISRHDVENNYWREFANEWSLFVIALGNRSQGWDRPDQRMSIDGIRGMERFRNYYQSNRSRISNKIKEADASWFKFDLKDGGLTIGCDKGAVVGWLMGCP